MFASFLLFLFSFSLSSFIKGEVLNENTAFLLTCPISCKKDLDLLRELSRDGHPIDIFQEKIELATKIGQVHVQLLTDDVTARFLLGRANCFEEKGRASVKRLFALPLTNEKIGNDFHEEYRSYGNILKQLNYYQQNYPNFVKEVRSIGKSHEQRDLMVIHITSASNKMKPLVWIQAGQHAREWISTSSAMFLIDLLLKSSINLLEKYEFAILPLANPDGYEYSRTRDRMWRKNRRVPYGVDLNRNWDYKWGEIGVSKNKNSQDYCGPSAASEPEIQAIQKYILSLPNRAIGFDVHSYGQLILRNYGWTRTPAPNEKIISPLSNHMASQMKSLYNVNYRPMLSAALYPTSGGAEDWMYVKAGIPGIIIELRDQGQNGFLLPTSHIIPTGTELYEGIVQAVSYGHEQELF